MDQWLDGWLSGTRESRMGRCWIDGWKFDLLDGCMAGDLLECEVDGVDG